MNLPGLLIEYLINVSIVLIWIVALLDLSILPPFVHLQSFLLIPIVYVLGMMVDFIAWLVTSPLKGYIRNKALLSIEKTMAEDGISFNKDDFQYFWAEKLTIAKDYPDLDKELTSRSSRDRIARGLMVNLIPITIIYWSSIHIIGVALFIVSLFMWMRFEEYNRQFEIRAAHSVRKE